MIIKPIETVYNGYRFRSGLEARWAVFFDTLGIKYEYEKEGFDLGDGIHYLPDFWLPQVNMWAEVKPTKLTVKEEDKCNRLVVSTGAPCLLLIGVPENTPYNGIECNDEDPHNLIVGGCQKTEFCLTAYHGYPYTEGRFYCCPGGHDDSHFDDTEEAANTAKSARFEFDRWCNAKSRYNR